MAYDKSLVKMSHTFSCVLTACISKVLLPSLDELMDLAHTATKAKVISTSYKIVVHFSMFIIAKE